MRARSLAVSLWRRRMTAAVVFVVTLVLAVAWLSLAPRRYVAVAAFTAAPQPGLNTPPQTVEAYQNTLAELANSVPVLQDVRSRVDTQRSLATLQHEVRGFRVPGTLLIRIRVTDANPAVAARVADTVAAALPLHDPSGGRFLFTDAGRAATATRKSGPPVAVVLGSAIGVGIVLALVIALLREAIVGRVEDPEQLAVLAGAPVLGSVGRPAELTSVPAARPGRTADDLRRVRVALEYAGSVELTRAIVLASACTDPATGWLAVNLAASLAEVDHRVLLIDADFGTRSRHPVLAAPDQAGLVDVLAGTVPLDRAVIKTDVPGVSVLPVGTLDGAAIAALVELRFRSLLDRVSADEYDLVLVHAAALADSDDAQVMAAGNGLLLSVPTGRLRAAQLRQRLTQLPLTKVRMIGVIALEAPAKR